MRVRLMAATIGVLLAACATLCYLWIDRSISLAYARDSADAAAASTRRLERLLGAAWDGMPEDQVLAKLQREAARHPNEPIVVTREKDVIWFDETRFVFVAGRLRSVGER